MLQTFKQKKMQKQFLNKQIQDQESTFEMVKQNDADIGNEKLQLSRKNVRQKVMNKKQVQIGQKFVLYQLIKTQQSFDLYKGIALTNKVKVIVKIIDKTLLKQNIQQENNKLQKLELTQLLQKVRIEDQIQSKEYDRITSLFSIHCLEVMQNQDYHIKVTQNYFDQSLENVLKRRNNLPLSQSLAILKQLILQISELHKDGVILTEFDPQFIIHRNGVYKISDFSSMRKVNHKFVSSKRVHAQTIYTQYVAPQIKICPQIIDMKSQIWALGILFYYLVAQGVPYQERGPSILKQIQAHHIMFQMKNGQASQEVLEFIKLLLAIDPEQRISWKRLLYHPIFQNQEYFSSIKLSPLVDARDASLKKKQKDMIPEQILNGSQKMIFYNQNINTVNKNEASIISFTQVPENKMLKPYSILDIEDDTYFYVKKLNLMALKADYIYHQILQNIFKYDLIDYKRRSHLQVVFMIVQKCHQYLMKAKNFQKRSSDRRLQNYLQQLKRLSCQVKQLFDQICKKLNKIDKSTYYVSNDLFTSMLKNSKAKQKDRFLKGKQGINYQCQQKIQFTQQKYINKILSQMKGQITVLEYAKLNMSHYKEINLISQDLINRNTSFSEIVAQIINHKSK